MEPPQPSPTTPRSVPLAVVHCVGVQTPESRAAPHTPGIPAPPQVCPPEQPPQSCCPPQPSPTVPQYLPFACWQAMGVHAPESGAEPHTLGMPSPPQVCPVGHMPQSCLPPQPLPTMPQYWPLAFEHCVGVQAPESVAAPQTPGRPAPPQV